ncbi:MAG: UvrB/UvrC motif-containing protein [Candidatus Hydrothermales bacterium]
MTEKKEGLCEKCKIKKAEIKVTIFEGGKKVKLYLCKDCAEMEAMGLSESSVSSLPVPKKETSHLKPEEDLVCINCGLKLSEFLRVMKLKCEKCYESFEPHVSKIVYDYHRATEHRGKIYGGVVEPNKEFKLRVLKRALEEAIKKEEFERAARLRDLLKEVEGSDGT